MNRRKKKLVRQDLQFKVVFITLFVASFVLLINLQLVLASLWFISSETPGGGAAEALLGELRGAVVGKFVISLAVAVPLSLSVGILYSFRFSGPIYHFKRYFSELPQGRWDQPLKLRKGDQLTDLSEVINHTMGEVCQRMRSTHSVLQEVQEFLDALPATEGDLQGRVESLKDRLAQEEKAYLQRVGDPSNAGTEPASVPAEEESDLIPAGT